MNLQENVDLTPLNTFRLKSSASHYLALTQIEQLDSMSSLTSQFPRFFVLGGGSNLIVPPSYEGLVIHNQLRGVSMTTIDGHRMVTAMAGEPWDDFVAYCNQNGAYGLENLSLIPGTVGASPIQNIGAYGVEVKDFIEDVCVYDLHDAKRVTLSHQACEFSYRNSSLKNNSRYIVVSVRFRLLATPKLRLQYGNLAEMLAGVPDPTPADLRRLIINIRQSKLPDPQEIGNAGSFFHNPILPEKKAQELLVKYPNMPMFPTTHPEYTKVSAGWLIDNLGLKGHRQGNVGIYTKQALVLVNYGGASQSELLRFADWVQAQIQNAYDVHLNIEPIIC